MEAHLVKRLEQTVNRLEQFITNCDSKKFGKATPTLSQIQSTSMQQFPKIVAAYDEAVDKSLKNWAHLSQQIGGDVKEISGKVMEAFCSFRDFLLLAAGRVRPTETELQSIVAPIFEIRNNINKFREEKRISPFYNHISCVDEGIQSLLWITVKDTPASFVKEMSDASLFYNNRILTQYKDVDKTHVEWANVWKKIWDNMYTFVKTNHTTGLVWYSDPQIAPASKTIGSSSSIPPPPPPPIPQDLLEKIKQSTKTDEKSKRDALFEQINQGSKITSGLKKVTADMQTHKNALLRKEGSSESRSDSIANSQTRSGSSSGISEQRDSEIYLQDGKQWNVDFVVNDSNVHLSVDDKKQTVYIYKCKNSVIKIKGKANAITLDGCNKTSVVFDGLVAQIEIINCQSVQIYLSKIAKNAQIVSSKSSEMNILAQLNDDNEEYTELAVPEQFVTTIVGKKLQTTASAIV